MADTKKQNYLQGAAILAFGVVIMKILGAIYKIPIGNILGDDGYALFLSAYNVYNVFLTLATAGLPVALSRMIAEANTNGQRLQVRRTFSVALVTFAVIGAVCSLIMFLFPTELADALNNVEASQSIWALSPAVLIVCLISAYRGYCQGHENMIPTTVGQVLEVLLKVIVGLVLAWYLVKIGKSTPVASAGAIFGVVAGSLIALVYMFVYKRRHYADAPTATPDTADSRSKILKRLLRIGIPITIGASGLSIINLIDTSLCMGRLQDAAGFTYDTAKVLYGVYGKAQTLYNLPAAFITPLTISVVPAIVAALARSQKREASSIAEASMRIAAVISLPMGIGLAVLSVPIMGVLYPGSNAAGPGLLSIMGVAAFFVCMALITNAVLQANGKEKYTVYSMIVGGLVKIVVNWVLVGNPDINITGAPVGTLTCYIVMCAMNFLFIAKTLDSRPKLGKIVLRPLVGTAVMGAGAWAVYGLASRILAGPDGLGRIKMALCMVAAMAVAVILYLIMIIVTRAITAEDMKLIPKGEKIAKLLHIK